VANLLSHAPKCPTKPFAPTQLVNVSGDSNGNAKNYWTIPFTEKTNRMHNGLGALVILTIRVITVQSILSTRKKTESNNDLDRKKVRHWKSKRLMCQQRRTKYHLASIESDIFKQMRIAKQTCGLWR
jgi:hypothetical protein